MNSEEILKILEKVNAIQYGHFILSSGKRSSTYCQCAKIFIDPKVGSKICNSLAKKIKDQIDQEIDYVVSPAMGGILVGYETANHLDSQSVFFERVENEFQMRRGFEIEENKNVLFVEDVITTGKSSKECLVELKKFNINLLGVACIVDRSSENIFSDHQIISLIKLDIPVYDEEDLPDKLKSINPVKPGSRII
jgi:orotate phosphoribosyltransferase